MTRRDLVVRGMSLAAAGGLLAACGGEEDSAPTEGGEGGGGDAKGVDEARSSVAKWEKAPSEFEAPGPEFDATAARGRTVWAVLILSIPFAQINAAGYEEALTAAGIELVKFDGKASVQQTSRGIQQAIAQRADLLLVQTLPATLFASDFARATQSGIPVVMVENQDPGPRNPDEPDAVAAGADQCHQCVGEIQADFTIADSGGEGKAVVVWSADIPGIGQPQLDGITSEFKRLAPDFDVDVKDVPIARWESGLPTLTQSLVRDPSVKYLLPLYDGMVLHMLPAVHAAGAQDRVKIVTFNATPSVLESLKEGDVVAANIGANPEQFGWAWADQTLRLLSDIEPVADIKLPIRLFTENNIDTIDLDAPQQTWYGDTGFKDDYKKLWGVA